MPNLVPNLVANYSERLNVDFKVIKRGIKEGHRPSCGHNKAICFALDGSPPLHQRSRTKPR